MAVGARIASVFNGAADNDAYNQVALIPRERTIKSPSDAKRKRLESLYAQVRDIRERKVGYERLGEIWETQQKEHADDWLLSMEIFEILDETGQQNALKQQVMTFLNGQEDVRQRQRHADRVGFPARHVSQDESGARGTAAVGAARDVCGQGGAVFQPPAD